MTEEEIMATSPPELADLPDDFQHDAVMIYPKQPISLGIDQDVVTTMNRCLNLGTTFGGYPESRQSVIAVTVDAWRVFEGEGRTGTVKNDQGRPGGDREPDASEGREEQLRTAVPSGRVRHPV